MRSATGSSTARPLLLLGLFLAALPGCAPHNTTYALPTVNNNVCKRLQGHVVYYAVFVDTKTTAPWSTHDIASTMDSIRVAMDWVEAQAAQRGISLKIDVVAHQQNGILPVRAEIGRKGVQATLLSPSGARAIDRWADKAGRLAAMDFPPDTARITRTKNAPTNTERLIARLRDVYKVDDVALFYMLNNYYREDASVVLHAGENDAVEYGVQSFKSPSVIAHEFLHLFGALDLYMTPFDKARAARKRKAYAMKEFPDELMAFAQRDLDSLRIGALTEYLIGWRKELDPRYVRMITGKNVRVVKY